MEVSGSEYIDVVFNRPLWETFTYRLPAELSGGGIEGCRLVVPFGSSRLVGYAWRSVTEPPEDGYEIRDIISRLDSTPLMPRDVMDLVRWAADYYKAPPGMMVAAAHPPGIAGRAERVVTLRESIPSDHPLEKLLPSRGSQPVKVLQDHLPKDYPMDKELASLESRGFISVTWRPVAGPKPVWKRIVEPVLKDDSLLVRKAEAMKRRAPRQAEILVYLAATDVPVSRRELLRCTGASASSLNGLIKKGLLKETRSRAFREPDFDEEMQGYAGIPEMNAAQKSALDSVEKNLDHHRVFLLHGVTGSGKTEVYLQAISRVLQRGDSALVMVPEISLTPLTVSRFNSRFPGEVAVIHSGMSPGERLDSWNLIRSGRRRIAVGPRSAVFAPLQNLGIVVVDEEHDSSYKQNELPHYNGRDTAIVRGSEAGIPVLLGSASPSMESYGNCVTEKYKLLELKNRIDSVPMPSTRLVDQSVTRDRLLSNELLSGIGKRTARGEQSIVLINRRGFSPTQMCRNCGYREECPNCGVTLTYHRKGEVLKCHHCDHWKPALSNCPRCGFNEFSHMGPGIQKVQQSLKELLPETRVIRMDADTTKRKNAHWRILSRFGKGEGDVLLGTQMVAKGHDFPNVTLVGIISADMGLAFPDFRAAERTFQLILQVAGRAGRGGVPGEVIIQAYNLHDKTIKAASNHDFEQFWNIESGVRKLFGYPPFGYLVRLVWSGRHREKVRMAAENSVRDLEMEEGVILSGPMEAAFPRINKRWRWSVLARAGSRKALGMLADRIKEKFEKSRSSKGVRLDIDIDPFNLL